MSVPFKIETQSLLEREDGKGQVGVLTEYMMYK